LSCKQTGTARGWRGHVTKISMNAMTRFDRLDDMFPEMFRRFVSGAKKEASGRTLSIQ
jgi:hypothetical protein